MWDTDLCVWWNGSWLYLWGTCHDILFYPLGFVFIEKKNHKAVSQWVLGGDKFRPEIFLHMFSSLPWYSCLLSLVQYTQYDKV